MITFEGGVGMSSTRKRPNRSSDPQGLPVGHNPARQEQVQGDKRTKRKRTRRAQRDEAIRESS